MKVVGTLIVILLSSLFLSAQSNPSQPTFIEHTMDGTKVDLEKLRGKVVVLNLWFINCPNCVEEIKLLNKLVDDYRDNKDVIFLASPPAKKLIYRSF